MSRVRAVGLVGFLLLAIAPAADATHAPDCFGMHPTIVGTSGGDNIAGTDGPDVIAGLAGNDHIIAEDGDDFVCGAGGNDDMVGSRGSDHISGGAGIDVIGGSDAQVVSSDPASLQCSSLRDFELTGESPDSGNEIRGGPGIDQLAGANGGDLIVGGPDVDLLIGDEGRDRLVGSAGDDCIVGGPGPDRAFGREDDDFMFGGIGADRLFGEEGADELRAEGDAAIDGVDGGIDVDVCSSDPQDLVTNCP